MNKFKSHFSIKFDGHNYPYKHVVSINTQMGIIEAINSLKYSLLYVTFKEVSLIWYMVLSCDSINSYQELVKKRVHYFTTNHHKKMSIISIFNIHQDPLEYLRDYLARFNETIIRVDPPKQISVGCSKMDLRRDTSTNPSPRIQCCRWQKWSPEVSAT